MLRLNKGHEASSERESGIAGHLLREGGQAHYTVIFPDLRSLPLSTIMKTGLMKSARELGDTLARLRGAHPTRCQSAPHSLGHISGAFASHRASTTGVVRDGQVSESYYSAPC